MMLRSIALVFTLSAVGSLALAAQPTSSHKHRVTSTPRPIDRSGKVRTGVASYYGKPAGAAKTASGATMNPRQLTAASRTLPLGTTAKVTNKENGRSTDVTITDRGPFAKSRILDVSPRAASELGMKTDGVSKVQVAPVKEPSPAPKADALHGPVA